MGSRRFKAFFYSAFFLSVLASPLYVSRTAESAPLSLGLTSHATGLNSPVDIAHSGIPSDSRLFVVEQSGYIKIVESNGTVSGTFLDIDSRVQGGGEEGLLGLAFHPNYSTNRYFFVYYINNSGDIVISRFTRNAGNANLADSGSEQVVLTIPHPGQSNHNGGDLNFNPSSGYLYAAVGDGGSGNDPPNNAQNLNVLLGKILRLDINNDSFTADPARNYAIPPGNPFAAIAGGDEIWAYGLRNPWRFSFDKATNDMYIGDVGQGSREEVDFQAAAGGGGQNYGWRCREGTIANPSNPSGCTGFSGYTDPIGEYSLSGTPCAVTGGYSYRGTISPSLLGYYFFADYCSGDMYTLKHNGSIWEQTLQTQFTGRNISSFGQDYGGELYVSDIGNGTIYKLTSQNDDTKPSVDVLINGSGSPSSYIVYGSGDNNLSASVSDDTGVTKVEFYVDDILYATDTSAPYSTTWDVSADTMPEGFHTVSAVAYDAAGNVAFDEFTQRFDTAYFLNYSCAGSPYLICEDFQTDAGEANFATAGGFWVMGGSIYYLLSADSAVAGNGNLSIHNTVPPGDFTLRTQVEANGTGPDLDFSIVWGYQDASNYYYASFSEVNSATSNGIFKVSAGTITELADFSTTIMENVPYKVKVEKSGSNYRVYRNGVSVGSVTDAAFATGKVGFGSRDDDQSFYYTTLESGTPPAYTPPPTDTTAPVVAITQPSNGAFASGPVNIAWGHIDNQAGASNAPAIASREVLVDGAPLTLTSADSIIWQSTAVANGPHTITVNAVDAAGNPGTASVVVNVMNDTTPPAISLTAPLSSAIVSGTFGVAAAASDNVGISRVEFYLDAALENTDTAAPYGYSWNTLSASNGSHSLAAKAYDAAGNVTTTSTISVTVKNIPHPDGTLVRNASTGAIYLIEDSQKRLVPSAAVFVSHFGPFGSQYYTANLADLNLASGPQVTLREGTLIKGGSAAVYIIDITGGVPQKRIFNSAAVFSGLGYSFADVLQIADGQLPAANGSAVSGSAHPDGSLIKTSGNPAVYLIAGGAKRYVPSANILLSNYYKFSQIKAATAADSALANGPALSLAEGTLIKGGSSAVYVIDLDGGVYKKRVFSSATIFLQMGFRFDRVYQLSDGELPAANGTPIS